MKLCTFCPKGPKCTGHILHSLILKIYTATEVSGNPDELLKYLSRDDLLILLNKGAEADKACWCKCFVLSVAHKFTELAGEDIPKDQLLRDTEEMLQHMDRLFSKLPKGNIIDLSELDIEIYNQSNENIKRIKPQKTFQVNVIGQACIAVMQKKKQS